MHVRFYQIVNRIVRRAVIIRFRAGVVLASVLVAQGLASGQTTETVRYYHTDAIGSVRAITDEAGQVVARYDFLPFGEEYPATPDPHVPLQFAGKERDYATGFDYFGARYYASQTGRFTSVDPALQVEQALVNPQQRNRYTYALNNPLKFMDRDGRNPFLVGGGIAAGVYALWNAYQNVQQGRSWYENIGLEASKGFLIGATLGLAAPTLAPAELPLVATSANVVASAAQRGLRFASQDRLEEHVGGHLREFSDMGFKSAQDYLAGATKLIDAAIRGVKGVETFVRANGDVLAYKRATNEFAVVNKLGVLRTYFRPNEEYEYWLGQIGK
jgi:RHS repeat-associated protein